YGCDVTGADDERFFRYSGPGTYERIFSSVPFDCCVNASGSPGVGYSLASPEKDYELNTQNVRLMLGAIRAHQPACRFINMSSAAVYGNPSRLPVSEDAMPAPLSPYGKHKLEAEQVLETFHREHDLRTVSLRVFSVYGPRLHKQLFWDIFQKTKQSKKLELFGTGEESRDFIYIRDLVRALETVMENGAFAGECINVASGVETTIREAASVFLDSLGGGFQLSFNGEVKAGDPKNWQADISRISGLGFKPAVTIAEGLALTVKDYRSV
ncbi:MAG TPA: NAD-dependent epimerase/dehydratase family protein, partial [Bacteroidia bacterium]|nr:NAD-dependent epimerase/dehydratase family protein [Bacteroidia bacterium]